MFGINLLLEIFVLGKLGFIEDLGIEELSVNGLIGVGLVKKTNYCTTFIF